MADEDEKIMTIPLKRVKKDPQSKRASVAMKIVRDYVSKHMGVPAENVWIDSSTNEEVWKRGMSKPPAKLRVKVIKFEDDIVEVSIPTE